MVEGGVSLLRYMGWVRKDGGGPGYVYELWRVEKDEEGVVREADREGGMVGKDDCGLTIAVRRLRWGG